MVTNTLSECASKHIGVHKIPLSLYFLAFMRDASYFILLGFFARFLFTDVAKSLFSSLYPGIKKFLRTSDDFPPASAHFTEKSDSNLPYEGNILCLQIFSIFCNFSLFLAIISILFMTRTQKPIG